MLWLEQREKGISAALSSFSLAPPCDKDISGNTSFALWSDFSYNKPLVMSPDSFNCSVLVSSFFPTGKSNTFPHSKMKLSYCISSWKRDHTNETDPDHHSRITWISRASTASLCPAVPFQDFCPQPWLKMPLGKFGLGFHWAPSAGTLQRTSTIPGWSFE